MKSINLSHVRLINAATVLQIVVLQQKARKLYVESSPNLAKFNTKK